jgi:transcriptional regulator with XRE-family HTH domain
MNAMSDIKSPQQWMSDRGLSLAEVVAASNLEPRVVEAILHGRYTPSPEQRQGLAAALGVTIEQIAWGHSTPVEAMYGHGPQFGRSP